MGNLLDFLLQLIHISAFFGRNRHADDFTTKILRRESILLQVKHYGIYISLLSINFIYCYYKRNLQLLGKLNHFNGLLLYTFDRWDHQNNYVCYFCTSWTHILESLVPWCIYKSDLFGDSLHPGLIRLAILFLSFLWLTFMQTCVFNREGSNGLCDCTVLLGTLVIVGTEWIQQGGLTVVNMAHNR